MIHRIKTIVFTTKSKPTTKAHLPLATNLSDTLNAHQANVLEWLQYDWCK